MSDSTEEMYLYSVAYRKVNLPEKRAEKPPSLSQIAETRGDAI